MGSIQPRWRIIDQTLDRVRVELVKHPAFTAVGGPNAGSDKYQGDWDKLERYARILQNSLQSVENGENLLYTQTLAAKRVPPEHRFQVNQSMRARQSNLEHVHNKAQSLLDVLQGMIESYGRPDFGSLDEIAGKAQQKLMAMIAEPGKVSQPGINAPHPTTTAMPIHSILALIVFYLIHLRKRSRPA